MSHGELVGVEAVIDKDYASALLANSLPADLFVISTAVEKVALNYNQPDQRWLDRLDPGRGAPVLAEGHFPQRQHGAQDRSRSSLSGARRPASVDYQPGKYRPGPGRRNRHLDCPRADERRVEGR